MLKYFIVKKLKISNKMYLAQIFIYDNVAMKKKCTNLRILINRLV